MSNHHKIIVVTGASGFIGGHIVRLLLDRGYRARGVVRDLSHTNAAKLAFLRGLPRTNTPDGHDPLELVAADLQAGQYAQLLQATPFVYGAADPQKEIVDPAVNGTVD
ncbi:dihydroflavonol 4reductase, partial [Acanthamoeba castellanii str. Neff]